MQVSNQKRISELLGQGMGRILEFLLPSRCPGCSQKLQDHGLLCPACWAELTPLAAPFCGQCSLPFEFDSDTDSSCGACIKQKPEFDYARSAVIYDAFGKSMVLKLKHSAGTVYVPVMAQMMIRALGEITADVVMPVPLHAGRLLKRRFNQSQLLAKEVSKSLAIELDCFSLRKVKATASQGGLDRAERLRNVSSCFKVHKQADIADKSILLVDDVLTTGATAEACARELKKAGAREVGVVTFARVGKPIAG